jgi:hypothetical protein
VAAAFADARAESPDSAHDQAFESFGDDGGSLGESAFGDAL